MTDSDNYIFPSKLRMEMLINEANGSCLRYGVDYDFEVPKASYGSGLRYNTSLVLAFKGIRLGMKERVFYRRISIDYLRKLNTVPVFSVDANAFHVSDILDRLNKHYGTALELDEFINERFIVNPALLYECRISDKSIAWNNGSLPFRIDTRTIVLSEALPVVDLDGLYSPAYIL